MAHFTRLAAAIAAASLAGAVHAAPTVEFSGEVDFLASYADTDSGSESSVELDTLELGVKATEGAVKAGFMIENDGEDIDIDNAFLEYKINDNYTAYAKYDDTQKGFALNSAIWSDVLADNLVDFKGTAAGVKIKGGPISSTIYVMSPNDSGEDDLQEFGTSVDFSHDMFNAHFGYLSVAQGMDASGNSVILDTGAFSLAADASIEDITLIAEYNWLSSEVNNEDPTFLHLEANYEMEGYTFALAFDDTNEASSISDEEQQIAIAVTKGITDMLWVQGEVAFVENYDDTDTTLASLVVGASF